MVHWVIRKSERRLDITMRTQMFKNDIRAESKDFKH